MKDQTEKDQQLKLDFTDDSLKKYMSKKRIIKNIAIMSVGVFVMFTAYDGPTMLQSTMNKKQGIGVASQAIIYACFCLSALLLPKYVIKKLGSKMTFVISMVSYIPYIAANFYPHWAVMIPAAILLGFGSALLWGSQANYLNDISVMFAELCLQKTPTSVEKKTVKCVLSQIEIYGSDNNKSTALKTTDIKWTDSKEENLPIENKKKESHYRNNIDTLHLGGYSETITEKTAGNHNTESAQRRHVNILSQYDLIKRKKKIETITARIFGLHGMSYLSCHLWSNVMSYFILKSGVDPFFTSNITSCECGADYCNVETNCLAEELDEVSDSTRYTLTTVCVSLAIISVVLVVFLLDSLESKRETISFNFQLLTATFRLAKRTDLLLLIPLSFYTGQVKGFFVGDYTKAYISCAWGTYHVSLVSACYGFFCAFSSSISGWLVKILGRKVVMTFFALLNTSSCILLLLWSPDPNKSEMIFVAAGMWGAYVGTTWAQLRAFYGVLFKEEEEAAFATFHVWYSLGYCLSFAYSSFFCTSVKIYVLLFVSILGYFGYLFEERNVIKNYKK